MSFPSKLYKNNNSFKQRNVPSPFMAPQGSSSNPTYIPNSVGEYKTAHQRPTQEHTAWVSNNVYAYPPPGYASYYTQYPPPLGVYNKELQHAQGSTTSSNMVYQ